MQKLFRLLVLFGFVALVCVPPTVAAQSVWDPVEGPDVPAQRPAAAAQANRHIIGVTDVPAAQRAAAAAQLRVLEVIPLIDAMVVEGPEQAVRGLWCRQASLHVSQLYTFLRLSPNKQQRFPPYSYHHDQNSTRM
jgi:hypothetical protein